MHLSKFNLHEFTHRLYGTSPLSLIYTIIVNSFLSCLSSLLAWNKLHTGTSSHKRQLEDALLRLGQFNEALDGLLSWIAKYIDKLEARPLPGALLEDLESQKADMQVSISDLTHTCTVLLSVNLTCECESLICHLWAFRAIHYLKRMNKFNNERI